MADTYSWDTSVILAWFMGEDDKPLGDIEIVFREIESARANLVVSIMTYSEVLAVGDSEQAAEEYRRFLERSNVLQVNVDPPVAAKAVEIRERTRNAGIKCPKAADAQIIATAVLYKATVLHSFDDGMLRLDSHPIVDGLKIVPPVLLSGQKSLYANLENNSENPLSSQ